MKWQERISVDPRVSREGVHQWHSVMVSVVLVNVAVGEPLEAIMSGYHIGREDIQASLHYAAAMAQDR